MLDFVPILVDDAVVFTLENYCISGALQDCEPCEYLSGSMHNWLKHSELPYLILDFMDSKHICSTLLQGMLQIKKRSRIPCLFSGVTRKPQEVLHAHDYHSHYPFFFTPEDAIRALRMQYPGLTETPSKIPVHYGEPLTRHFDCEKIEQILLSTKKKQLLLSDW